MEDFEVTITRTITTVISAPASSREKARNQITAYGIVEAANDFNVHSEDMQAKITKVTPCTTP